MRSDLSMRPAFCTLISRATINALPSILCCGAQARLCVELEAGDIETINASQLSQLANFKHLKVKSLILPVAQIIWYTYAFTQELELEKRWRWLWYECSSLWVFLYFQEQVRARTNKCLRERELERNYASFREVFDSRMCQEGYQTRRAHSAPT